MSAKFSASRKQAFLRALSETGNQTLAAERAKVSRSWVQLHRSGDPAFRRAVEQAVAEAKAGLLRQAQDRLRDAQGERGYGLGGNGAGYANGEELVVRGTGGSGGGKRVQVARSRVKQWTPRVEERFLAALAGTCNVKAACAQVGLTPASAYNHRNRWPGFQRRWDAALELGFVLLEGRLVEAACNFFSPPEDAPIDPEITGMSFAAGLHLLHMHKHQVRGVGKKPGAIGKPPDMDEVRDSILRKMDAFDRHEARKELERWRKAFGGRAPATEIAVPTPLRPGR